MLQVCGTRQCHAVAAEVALAAEPAELQVVPHSGSRVLLLSQSLCVFKVSFKHICLAEGVCEVLRACAACPPRLVA